MFLALFFESLNCLMRELQLYVIFGYFFRDYFFLKSNRKNSTKLMKANVGSKKKHYKKANM